MEYTFLGRECKSTGIGKIEAEVFMSQEEIFIPRSDSWLSSRGLTPLLNIEITLEGLPRSISTNF